MTKKAKILRMITNTLIVLQLLDLLLAFVPVLGFGDGTQSKYEISIMISKSSDRVLSIFFRTTSCVT